LACARVRPLDPLGVTPSLLPLTGRLHAPSGVASQWKESTVGNLDPPDPKRLPKLVLALEAPIADGPCPVFVCQ